MIHHGDEKIQQHNNIYDGVTAEHQHSPEARKYFYSIELKTI